MLSRHENASRWAILLLILAGTVRADDDRDRAVMDRFLTVLEKTPRRGTALDRVYGYHVERGSLEELLKAYRDRPSDDGSASMLVGLIESQRGRDSAAVAAFKGAEAKRPEEALPCYYLGQSLVMVGEPTLAAEAFERALTRNPSRSDMLDIFQALGRVHQRAYKDDLAMGVWTRLEGRFPDDPKVKELIASSLAEESKFEPALVRYEDLARAARDPYRRVQFRLESADLKVKLGRKADALRDFEGLLATLDPESWLGREVRRKIEDVFLRDDDQAGLSGYYEGWIKANSEDVEAMTRLARTLATQGRAADARTWLDQALKLAPSRKGLRLAMADQLAVERKFAEAADQYELLSKAEPTNPDLARDWGRMLLRDGSKPEPDRKRRAAEVWNRLVEARPNDASAAAQVAELYRQAGMVDEAVGLYRKAVELSPGSPQYREYLGEYYHALKRPDDALATWRGMAEGAARDSKNLRRLAEVLDGFGYKDQAVAAIADACSLEPDSFDLRLKHADLLLATRKFDDADAQLALAEELADSEESRDDVLTRRIAGDEASGRLKDRLEVVRRLANEPGADSAAWRRLARYAEAARQSIEAVAAAEKSVAIDPRSVAALATLARLCEARGRFLDAAEACRKLAAVDRRARSEHLTDVARLEAALGRRGEALAAGRDLLAASPGNPEALRFFADLCFQLGEREEGLETLRKAARGNSAEIPALLNLAEALGREFRTEEAIEQLWRAFERSIEVDAKLGIVARLADLHLRRNQVDRLVGRLERLSREEGHQREGALCLAQAYASIGDVGTARQQVEGLLATSPRDTGLLKQLSNLAEQDGDLSLAVKFQKQLVDLAPGPEAATRLVQLALRSGEFDVAEAIWSKSAEGDGDSARVLSALDNLSQNGKAEAVLATTTRLLAKNPANWEMLYREGRALLLIDRRDEAKARFQAILDLNLNDDDVSAIVKARSKAPAPGGNTSTLATTVMERVGGRYRTLAASRVGPLFGLDSTVTNLASNTWYPGDFGQARIAALGGLLSIARRDKSEPEWLASRRKAIEASPDDVRKLRDDYYLALLLVDPPVIYRKALALSRAAGHEASSDVALLLAMIARNNAPGPRSVRASDEIEGAPPLAADELDQARDALVSLGRTNPSWLSGTIESSVEAELRKAGRGGELDGFYRELLAGTNEPFGYGGVAAMAGDRGDIASLEKLAILFDRLPASVRTNVIATQPYYITTPHGVLQTPSFFMAQAMRVKADAKAHGEILALLDRELVRLRTPTKIAERARATRTSSPVASRYAVYLSSGLTLVTVDYPTANSYLGHDSIQLLRAAFALFQRDEKLADLKDQLRRSADANPTDVSARLAVAAVLWWAEEKAEAVAELNKAVALVPGDVELKLGLAELRAQRRESEEALAVLDSIEATDQDVVKRREILALRMAVQAGRVDRASLAAERLFGLRLDNATQLQLATSMRQLGMNEMADAVLARARRRSGNDVDSLVALMSQYRRQGDVETAAQIALQVLRKAPTRSGVVQATDLDDPNHARAIQVLAGSGMLKEQISRVEAQVKLSPNSLPLHQTLISYYRASNQPAKLKGEYEAILRIRPDDMRLRMQVAGKLVELGPENIPLALDQYRAVLKKDSTLFIISWSLITNTFNRADRTDDLLALLDEVGLKAVGSYGPIANLISVLSIEPRTAEQGRTLLAKAWDVFPADREFLIRPLLGDEAFWSRSESFRLAKEAMLPPQTTGPVDSWAGLDAWNSPPSPSLNRTANVAARMLDLAGARGKLDELAADLGSAIGRWPRWQAGRTLLGLVRVRQGRVDEGKAILESQLNDPSLRPGYGPLMLIGQETRDVPDAGEIASLAYRKLLRPEADLRGSWGVAYGMPFSGSAARFLALLEHRSGRDEAARALLREALVRNGASSIQTVNQAYGSHLKLVNLATIGDTSREIGDAVGSLHAYDAVMLATEEQQSARSMLARAPALAGPEAVDQVLKQAREGIDRTIRNQDREAAASVLRSLVPVDGKKPVDLALIVHPRDGDRPRVVSPITSAIASSEASGLAALKAGLAGRPDELKASLTLVLANRDLGEFDKAVEHLEATLAAHPLETIAPGKRANARQQAEAVDRLGLWLVARECRRRDAARSAGDRLADLAIEAARRQVDPTWALAMLGERGQVELDEGNRDGALARWSSMLDLILDAQPTAGSRVPSLTLDRFRQAAQLAKLAAEAGMIDLSLRAVRESLKGGPPVAGAIMTSPTTTVRVVSPVVEAPDPVMKEVEVHLLEINFAWSLKKVAPEAAYEVLRDVVMPPSRPNDMFVSGTAMARCLVLRAAEANRLDDLRDRVNRRTSQPASKNAGRLLSALINEEAARSSSKD